MSIFNKLKEPIFFKTSSSAEKQLEQLQSIDKTKLDKATTEKLEQEMKLISIGIQGEKNVEFELRNSYIPMYILHDLYLRYGELSAQIDYLIITRGYNYVIECKNLYGNIEINSKGDFIRTTNTGKHQQKEGIYSPITQNRRHLELIKKMRGDEKGLLTKGIFEKNFYKNYLSVVVLANPKTILNDRYAKKEIKEQIIRADALSEHIRNKNLEAKKDGIVCTDDDMLKLANFFKEKHIERNIDFTEKYRMSYIESSSINTSKSGTKEILAETNNDVICPKCGAPMCLRTAKKGDNAGKQFWGCSKFPSCKCIVNV